MGNGLPYKSPVNAVPKDGTTLAEILVPHIRDAHNVVGMQPEDYTPVSLVPMRSASICCGCPCCWTSIPAGFFAVVSRFGADVDGGEPDQTWSAGYHCFWPWYSVNRLVSKQLIIFDTPVKDCKTSDNITVNIDVLIVLQITNAQAFIYGLGPEKLDSLLRASQEEVLRQVAYTTSVEQIYDLHGCNTEDWVTKMNANFANYGVTVHHFTVRNVQIPGDMAKDFEDKTLYESQTMETKVQQEADRLNLNNEEERLRLKEECENTKMAAEEQGVTLLAQMVKECREVTANTDKDMGILDAERAAQVADLKVQNDLEVAKIKAQILSLEREHQAKLACEVGKLESEAEAYEQQKKAQARMEASQKIAEGKKEVAKAEGEATTAFAQRRKQEQDMARLDILDKLANNKNIKIATSFENRMGLAPDNSLVSQVAQQGMEAVRMKLADWTASSAGRLKLDGINSSGEMKTELAGGLVRAVAQQTMKDS